MFRYVTIGVGLLLIAAATPEQTVRQTTVEAHRDGQHWLVGPAVVGYLDGRLVVEPAERNGLGDALSMCTEASSAKLGGAALARLACQRSGAPIDGFTALVRVGDEWRALATIATGGNPAEPSTPLPSRGELLNTVRTWLAAEAGDSERFDDAADRTLRTLLAAEVSSGRLSLVDSVREWSKQQSRSKLGSIVGMQLVQVWQDGPLGGVLVELEYQHGKRIDAFLLLAHEGQWKTVARASSDR